MRDRRTKWICALLMAVLLMGAAQFAMAEGGDLRNDMPAQPRGPIMSTLQGKAALRGITMKKTSATVALTSTFDRKVDLSAYVRAVPSNATLPELIWTTTDERVAPVDPLTGIVTFADEGKVRITAMTPEGRTASMVITIKPMRVKAIKSSGTITLGVGDVGHVQTVISPATATYPQLRYETSDPSIATVDADGKVTAQGPGVARITVATDLPIYEKRAATTIQVRSGNGVSLTISAVGDITLGGDTERGTYQDFKKYLTKYEKETGNRWTGMLINAAKYFSQDDLTIANLEGALTNQSNRPKGRYHYKGDPAFAQILAQSSIEAVNLANNHTRGYEGSCYANTKSALNKVGVKWNGFGINEAKVLNINGLSVGIIGFQTGSYGSTASGIKSACQKMKKKCDIVIASIHFCDTPEYTNKVLGTMKTYARTAITYGADLVLGHHPHVISGMESYKGRNIVYGLGTFLGAGENPIRPRRTFIYQQSFTVYPDFTEVKNTKIIPFWITSSNKLNDKRPMNAPGNEADKIIQTIEKYSVGQKVDYEVIRG